MERSERRSMAVASWSVLSLGSASSLSDDTVAVLVTDAGASLPTSTVRENDELAPAARSDACVHVTSWPTAEQLHPEPAPDTKDNPAGRVSLTTIGPVAA